MTRFFIMLIGLCLASLTPAATLYVSTNGASSTPPYDTWAKAATNIQNAVYAATNDVVLVTNGTYTFASSLSGTTRAMIIVTNIGVTLQSVNGPAATIVNGGNTGEFTNRCFYISNAVVSGFTITNGRANATNENNRGGGVYLKTSGTLTNCWITGNSTTNAPSVGGGGGVYMTGGTQQNCVIFGNSATNYGGGVYCDGSGLLQDCTISNNLALGENNKGGGIYLSYYSSGGVVTNCRITQNILQGTIATKVPAGAGVYMANGRLIDCTVNNNTGLSVYGGGVGIVAGVVSNCVIVGNSTGRGEEYVRMVTV